MDVSPKQQRMVMLVEDCEIERMAYRRHLESDARYEYSYLIAESEEEALTAYEENQHQIDVVLLDYFLLDTNGLELLSLWQQRYGNELCPIIALTGQRDESVAVQFIKLGAVDYVVKDRLSATKLRLTVDNAIANHQIKAKLLVSENFFRNTFELAAVGMARIGVDGKWLQVNPQLCQILGYSSAELLQKNLQGITHPEDIAADFKYIKQLKQGEIDSCHFEKRYIRHDARIVWTGMTVSSIRDKLGTIDYLIAVIEDISDRKQAELNLQESKRKLEQANAAKDTFIAQMSHEFRTPLNSVIGCSELLTADPNITAEQLRYVRLIERSGRHLLSLVNQVLDVSAIEAGKLGLVLEEFNLISFLKNIADTFHIFAQRKGLNFQLDLDPALPVAIKTDPTKLQQILINLLNNAIKYTDNGGINFSITVVEKIAKHQTIQFKIADTGGGIPSEQWANVFNPFEQLDTHRQSDRGTGLGLTITENLLRLLDSNMQLSSQVGEGSQFWFELKVATVDNAAAIEITDLPLHDAPEVAKIATAFYVSPLESPFKIPSQIKLDNIAKLLKYGDVEAISQQLQDLETLEPECQIFIQQAQDLVNNFELKKLEKLLNSF